jgi:hypothetical protein
LNRYTPVRISRSDCVFISRRSESMPFAAKRKRAKSQASNSDTYEDFYAMSDPDFEIGLVGGSTGSSRHEAGCDEIGDLRVPRDAPRKARSDAPSWFDSRHIFFDTLRGSRRERAERILYGYYINQETDRSLAAAEKWAKDAIKKERKELIAKGTAFFEKLGTEHPPSPAIYEGRAVLRVAGRDLPLAEFGGPTANTDAVAVCSPNPETLRLYPVVWRDRLPQAKCGSVYVPLSELSGFLRLEFAIPKLRNSQGTRDEAA